MAGSPELQQHAARLWTRRVDVELEAAARFVAIAAELRLLQAPHELVEWAERCAADERRHAELCAERVVAMGGTVPTRDEPHEWLAPSGFAGRERLLYECVAVSCVTETVATAIQVKMLAQMPKGRARTIIHEVAKDEVQHARLGWAILAWLRDDADALSPHIPALAQAVLDGEPEHGLDAVEQLALGELDGPTRREVARETLLEVVLPGLESFGVSVEEARAETSAL